VKYGVHFDKINAKLMELEEKEEIVDFLLEVMPPRSKSIYAKQLMDKIHDFVYGDNIPFYQKKDVRQDKSEKELLEKQLKAKINYYIDYIKEEQSNSVTSGVEKRNEILTRKRNEKELELLAPAIETLQSFIDDESLIKEQSNKSFDNMVEIIKKYEPELYAKYIDKINDLKEQRFLSDFNNVKLIIDNLKNGIFDIVNYYSITKMSFSEIMNFANKNMTLSNEESRLLKTFFVENKNDELMDDKKKKEILNGYVEFDSEKDENRKPILGTGRVVSREEKKFVMDYLEKNSTLTFKTYKITLRRYIDSEITLMSEGKIQNKVKRK